jgi:Mu transposase, C-terminal
VPDTIVIDHGSVFVSDNFRSSCRHLGISIQPAHLATGSDKPHIEKMFSSLGTLFCQFAAGYLGRSADRRGRHVEEQPLWSLMQMQDLLDEWLISVWQNRAHDGLRDPLHPQRTFSPNQKYAALIETAGYVPVPLSAEDHIELLPAVWRAVNAYGIKINHRTYDAGQLNPIRQQKSGVTARKGQWEVRHDPYDVSKVFLRGPDGWITCPWKYLEKVPAPFGELAWDHVSGQLAAQGQGNPTELERALAVDDLLRRAYHGAPDDTGTETADEASAPRRGGRRQLSARDRRVAARTRAAAASRAGAGTPPAAPGGDGDAPQAPGQDSDEQIAKVIPLGIFDPFEEAKKPW